MPVPINLNSNINSDEKNNKLQMDYSWLLNNIPKNDKKIVTASNKDADTLMQIWLTADKSKDKSTNEEIFKIDGQKFSSQEIMGLKARGLVTGGSEEIKFTNRGKTVITTMALSENNGFLKNQKSKSYTEILAGMDKRGKSGYRIPTISSNQNSIRL